MKVKVAKQYLTECLEALNKAKGTDLKITNTDLCYIGNGKCNGVDFTLNFDTDLFFKLHMNIWAKITKKNQLDYQKQLMAEVWKQVKRLRTEKVFDHNQQTFLNSVGLSKVTINGLPDSKPVTTSRREPVYIDPNAAYIDTGIIYSKADIDMLLELEGFRRQQTLKQYKDDLL